MAVCTLLCMRVTPNGLPPATYAYRVQHLAHRTQLHAPDAAPAPRVPPPPTPLDYPSAGHRLRVWVATPTTPAPHPVIVYLHGGTGLSASEWEAAQTFVASGYAVVAPTWRGENGNPGIHELCHGEVDDAMAAVRWAAAREDLDGQRMFAFGHETGGVMAGFLAMHGELPLIATASVSALYQPKDLHKLEIPLPFVDTPQEREIRTLTPFFDQPVLPHIAYLGEQDPLVAPHADQLLDASERGQIRINLLWLPAGHHDVLLPAMEAFLLQIGD